MSQKVTEEVRKGIYLAARMVSEHDVAVDNYERVFRSSNAGKAGNQARICTSYCVDARLQNPFNLGWNMSLVDRNIAGRLAGTATLQFAYEDQGVCLAMSAGHEDCKGIRAAVKEVERLYDQVGQEPDLVRERVSKRREEIDETLHPKEKLIYHLLSRGGIDMYDTLREVSISTSVEAAMAEEWARQQIYSALQNEVVRNLVDRGRLVLASSMIRLPEEGKQETELNMVAVQQDEDIRILHGDDIRSSFGDLISKAFEDSEEEALRNKMQKRITFKWRLNNPDVEPPPGDDRSGFRM